MKSVKNGMKIFLLIISLMIIVGFFTMQARHSSPSTTNTISDDLSGDGFNAIYLCNEISLLSTEDLCMYPEIKAVHTFADFQRLSKRKKVALWIDKNAVALVDEEWLHLEPQKHYPLVLVGYNDAFFAYGDVFSGFGVERPNVDRDSEKLLPGFSVWMLKEAEDSSSPAFMYGYTLEPTIQGILKVTNSLLYGAELKRRLEK